MCQFLLVQEKIAVTCLQRAYVFYSRDNKQSPQYVNWCYMS